MPRWTATSRDRSSSGGTKSCVTAGRSPRRTARCGFTRATASTGVRLRRKRPPAAWRARPPRHASDLAGGMSSFASHPTVRSPARRSRSRPSAQHSSIDPADYGAWLRRRRERPRSIDSTGRPHGGSSIEPVATECSSRRSQELIAGAAHSCTRRDAGTSSTRRSPRRMPIPSIGKRFGPSSGSTGATTIASRSCALRFEFSDVPRY